MNQTKFSVIINSCYLILFSKNCIEWTHVQCVNIKPNQSITAVIVCPRFDVYVHRNSVYAVWYKLYIPIPIHHIHCLFIGDFRMHNWNQYIGQWLIGNDPIMAQLFRALEMKYSFLSRFFNCWIYENNMTFWIGETKRRYQCVNLILNQFEVEWKFNSHYYYQLFLSFLAWWIYMIIQNS